MVGRRAAARSIDHLLADFGAHLPRRPEDPVEPPPDKPFPKVFPARGVRKPGHGWAPTLAPLAGYQMTSEQTPVLWPLIAGNGLPPTGAPMGFDVLSGGAFFCDPMGWVNDDAIPVTNPNVFIFGKP
ncbi:MAG: ATP-binding protein, partial [Nocardioides sp.]